LHTSKAYSFALVQLSVHERLHGSSVGRSVAHEIVKADNVIFLRHLVIKRILLRGLMSGHCTSSKISSAQ